MKRKDAPRSEWLQCRTCKKWFTGEGSLERHQNQTGCCGSVQDRQEALTDPATTTAAQQEPLGDGPPLQPEIATAQGSHDLAIQLTPTAARLQLQRQLLSQQLSLSEEPGDSDSSPLLDHRLTEVEQAFAAVLPKLHQKDRDLLLRAAAGPCKLRWASGQGFTDAMEEDGQARNLAAMITFAVSSWMQASLGCHRHAACRFGTQRWSMSSMARSSM